MSDDVALPGFGKVQFLVREAGNLTALALESVRRVPSRHWPYAEFIEQCWFLAKVTTVPVILVAVPFAAVISLELGSLVSQLGAQAHVGGVLAVAVLQQLAPIVAVLLIAGAGGSAMTADLGARRIREEIDALKVMAVNPVQRLVMPRVLAAVVMSVLVTIVVSMAALMGGYFYSVNVLHISSGSFFASFNELAQLPDFFISLVKAIIFGFIAGVVACYKGLSCKGGPQGVGDAVNQSVVVIFLLLLFVNFTLTAVYINFVPPKFGA